MSEGVLIPGNKKEAREFNGKRYIMEPAIAGDVAFVHAWKADEVGNLVFRSVFFPFVSQASFDTSFPDIQQITTTHSRLEMRNSR